MGWDESRQAIRAVQDAMPLLRNADQVDIAMINKKGVNDIMKNSEIGTYLSMRNVKCRVHNVSTDKQARKSAQALLQFANEQAADLIVIGGYGHTRLREVVMGGVTRYMIEKTTLPILFSH